MARRIRGQCLEAMSASLIGRLGQALSDYPPLQEPFFYGARRIHGQGTGQGVRAFRVLGTDSGLVERIAAAGLERVRVSRRRDS
jgi:hypothetical protein